MKTKYNMDVEELMLEADKQYKFLFKKRPDADMISRKEFNIRIEQMQEYINSEFREIRQWISEEIPRKEIKYNNKEFIELFNKENIIHNLIILLFFILITAIPIYIILK